MIIFNTRKLGTECRC